ncbi:MAG: hypothetical protein PCFJNLEI_02462 [Verrucomicrobiae bacterium]|nr:hypothetical protein [Verrucomicrobiae bacterium]
MKLLVLLVQSLTLVGLLALPAVAAPKVRVTDPVTAAELRARGAQLIADYGSYQLFATTATNALPAVEIRHDYNLIALNSGPIDTTQPAAKGQRQPLANFTGRRLHLVQFAGPILPDWLAALQKTGVKLVDYVPSNTYLVTGDEAALAALQTWAATAPFVQWEAAYARPHKIHPRARATEPDWYKIQLVDDNADNLATRSLIEHCQLAPPKKDDRFQNFRNVTVRLTAADRELIADQPDVISIHRYVEPVRHGERQAQISAGNLSGNVPTGPGYLAWLAAKGFTQTQFDASDFVVDVSDSGIDNGTTDPNHFGLYRTGNLGTGCRIVYSRLEGSPNIGSTLAGCDGHGTLNAHIIAGYSDQTNFPFADASGYRYGLGLCPFVKLGASVIFDPDDFTNPTYRDLIARAYQDGARISNNSWGSVGTTSQGAYDSDTQEYDALVRDAQPTGAAIATPGNQEMVIIFAAGNDGPDAGSVQPPGTGKNIISVGAGEGVQAIGGTDGSGVADTGANSANDIISFSGRGPCDDSRKKPDLVAPGTHITGGVPQINNPGTLGTAAGCYDGSGISGGPGGSAFFPAGQQFYSASSGTSHATPAVAGATALLRQYFLNQFGTPPSPAMTKAFLLNSARYMTGTGANDTLPSNTQGHGGLDLGMAFDGLDRTLRDQLNADRFTATGQSRSFTGTVADVAAPFRVTLAWTDAPGSTTGNAYKNDLDLTVTIAGSTYKGNVFSGATSITGGSADLRNNVESVFLAPGSAGQFIVTVTAANIVADGVPGNGDALDQDFALVVYNSSQVPAPLLLAGPVALPSEGCGPSNGTLDPDETVTAEFTIRNTGTAATSNLVATLLATGGVTNPSGPQNYGVIGTNDASIARAFTFTASGSCGGTVTATLSLQDGTNTLGTIAYQFTLGTTSITFTQTFDGVTAPALPAGWTTTSGGGQSAWTTSTNRLDSPLNSAFSPNVSSIGSNALISPVVAIISASAKLTFRNNYSLEASGSSSSVGFDGGVLELKIGAGAFQDILVAGGSFTAGGYPRTLSTSYGNPLGGRQAWSGNSGGWLTTVVNLPASAAGQNVQFRWRCGTDSTVGSTGWYIDSLSVLDNGCCDGGVPLAASFTATPTNEVVPLTVTLADTSAGSITNRFWEFGNGGTSNTMLTTLQYTYLAVGTNTVKLTVSGPLGSNSTTQQVVVRPVDSVGDGIADAWRQFYFGGAGNSTNEQSCAGCDADGDGLTNLQEFHAGTEPTNAASVFRITAITATTTDVRLLFTTVTNKLYTVEWSTEPDGSAPTIVAADISGTGNPVEVTDPGGLSPVQRFYRVRLQP